MYWASVYDSEYKELATVELQLGTQVWYGRLQAARAICELHAFLQVSSRWLIVEEARSWIVEPGREGGEEWVVDAENGGVGQMNWDGRSGRLIVTCSSTDASSNVALHHNSRKWKHQIKAYLGLYLLRYSPAQFLSNACTIHT